MSKQLKWILLISGISIIIFSGCKKDNSATSSLTKVKDQIGNIAKHVKHDNVTITWTYTAVLVPGTRTGTVVSHGALETAGTTTMTTQVNGDILNCSQTLVSPFGTITMLSTCHLSTMSGIWWIVSGTGHYSEIRGNGTLMMSVGQIVQEFFTGRIKGGNDNEGENEQEHD